MYIFRIFLILFITTNFFSAQIPKFESNYSKNDSIENKDLLEFAQKLDFVITFHKTGYWYGNEKHYIIIALNKKRWEVWESFYRNENIRFKKINKQPASEKYDELISYFDKNKIWNINNEELNKYERRYFVFDGDTIFNRRDVVADSSTNHLNFITKNRAKTLGIYSSGLNSKLTIEFDNATSFLLDWWEEIIKKK